MTRRGEAQRPWTTEEIRYLAEHAGRAPLREICRHLKRPQGAVKMRAKRLGLSLRVPVWGLVWCDECATWRTSVSERTGRCRVCEMRHRTEGREAACADALASMTSEQRALYASTESRRGTRKKPAPKPRRPDTRSMGWFEAVKAERAWHAAVEEWEFGRAKLPYDAAKTRLRRMREAIGANPRKKKLK